MAKSANLLFRLKNKCRKLFAKTETDYKNIPIIINNYNRLNYLTRMISWFEEAGYSNIYIIDNKSTFAPLLDFYERTPHTVYKLNKNVGFLALWKTVIYTRFSDDYYVYTDPDILPIDTCPDDVLFHFKNILDKYEQVNKVGFGLNIDDLPDCYPLKENVVRWESKFWDKEVSPGIFDAPIDTTFALYRPGAKGGSELTALRTGYPYVAQHLPWYIDPKNYSEEEIHYQSSSSSASSWTSKLLGKKTISNY
ncbi:glycosyltransferase family 2 protein [Pontibacter pamirensis]|uniref:glycosyltransferase family 2 protein n=1 Tax=Pontibacter pamirensis TaxID=2562824 RepID=UPI00138A4716|nr:glycosyltransferase family 2 protein [Pontibacter pamirensis]